MKVSYLDELNLPQREAVEYIDGPALVIAGAGSGKTRVLTYKIMHLIENGFQPWNILAITFTNKAAREMKERIAQKIGEQKAAQLWMGTFHSIFLRILKVEVENTDYQKNFTIYDQADARNVVKGIIKEMKLDDKTYPVNDIASRISSAKNSLIPPNAYAASELYADDCNSRRNYTDKIYMQYARKCHQANAMDFDDLLLQTYILFSKHPELVKKYSDRFKYILVDEYQDTNSVQYMIVKALGSLHHKVFVVGDDAQS
ncbi:MAG: UvrD-helicase domain-containing protein, partial [Bacteroidales bacterium]|nr:UvrD-helicase domain-containing protein [Bacteroidales bacterium]